MTGERTALCGLLCTFLLAGCAGQHYHAPATDVSAEWRIFDQEVSAGHTLAVAPPEKLAMAHMTGSPWWRRFHDDTLSNLIESCFTGNYDLLVAEARIKEARANEDLSVSALLPQIDATGSGTREKPGGSLGNQYAGFFVARRA